MPLRLVLQINFQGLHKYDRGAILFVLEFPKNLFFILSSILTLSLINFLLPSKVLSDVSGTMNERSLLVEVFSTKTVDEEFVQEYDLLSNVDDFVSIPEGGTPWKVFGETGMSEYKFNDKEGNEWIGVRPEFTEKLKKLNSKNILIQGYMFPLEQDEKQSLFLLGPFPLSCPYHPHVSSNLLIEVHAKKPILFSYDAVNIEGKLELVPKDDDYNVFFRLKEAKQIH